MTLLIYLQNLNIYEIIISMNRNYLKIIACITMLIDHIGWVLFPDIIWFRVIGRLSFPLFAFFIAEGIFYSKDFKKYVLRLLIFAIISQIPFYLICRADGFMLNVLFTFLIAILLIKLIEYVKYDKALIFLIIIISTISLFVLDLFQILDYGLYGVMLVLIFYFFREKKIKYLLAIILMVINLGMKILLFGTDLFNLIQPVASLSLILIYFYNGNRGKYNLKYLFYIFYPAHLAILVLIKFLIQI